MNNAELSEKELLNKAAECEDEKEASFERCDTDGFLSQWASGLSAELYRKQAEIKHNGGWYEFPALFDLNGNRVRAKLTTRPVYGAHWLTEDVWQFYTKDDRSTYKFIRAFPKRETTMTNKGYIEGKELADAIAFMDGRGHGLSGSAWVSVKRLDNGYPVDAKESI